MSADQGARDGGTVVYAAFATDRAASPEIDSNEASSSNLNEYHVTGGTAFSVGSSRFSLGASYTFASRRRDLGLGGLPPSVPIIGEPRLADVSYSRWVLVLGYLFGR